MFEPCGIPEFIFKKFFYDYWFVKLRNHLYNNLFESEIKILSGIGVFFFISVDKLKNIFISAYKKL